MHFATHGALAGELTGTTEPGLILTPPEAATEEDDGYLSASEIAALKLDADWVILSACNTAAGGGDERRGAVGPGAGLHLRPGPRAAGVALGGRLGRHRQADHRGGRRDGPRQRSAAPRRCAARCWR